MDGGILWRGERGEVGRGEERELRRRLGLAAEDDLGARGGACAWRSRSVRPSGPHSRSQSGSSSGSVAQYASSISTRPSEVTDDPSAMRHSRTKG